LSARGTLTLQNNALLSAHFRIADHPTIGAIMEHFQQRSWNAYGANKNAM
jgi:hypothetical protein